MKKIKLVPVIFLIMLVFTSCAKVVKTENEVVKATIIDTYHRNQIIQPIVVVVNKMPITQIRTIPEVNRITVKYGNIEEDFSGKTLYNQYKDSIGTEIDVILETTYFDDGTTKQKLKQMG